MTNNPNNKKIIIAGSVIIILALAAIIYLAKTDYNQVQPYKNQEESSKNKEVKLSTYTNRPLGYQLSYPENLDVIALENNGVAFSQGGGPGISIQIFSKKEFPDENAWLEAENEKLKASLYLKDGDITVAGQKGISAHEVADYGENFPSPQIILFTKDDKLFVIIAPLEQMPMIMNSFQFGE